MKQTAIDIVKRLVAAGHVAYFNGGCVRDMVRGVEPQDIDIATSATPEEVQALFAKTVPVGAAFGVVLVLEGEHQFEVATFRSDDAYIDGRRPSAVHFGSPEQDARRRDFTINGLFYDPFPSSTGAAGVPACDPTSGGLGQPALPGQIIDFVGGRADIERKLIRTIGEPHERFGEDKLRLLRCIRFAANLAYEIDPSTFDAVKEMAPQINVVSAERIRDELIKLLTRPHAGRGLDHPRRQRTPA